MSTSIASSVSFAPSATGDFPRSFFCSCCAFPPLLVNLTRATLQKNMFFARCEAKAARKKVKKPFKNHHYLQGGRGWWAEGWPSTSIKHSTFLSAFLKFTQIHCKSAGGGRPRLWNYKVRREEGHTFHRGPVYKENLQGSDAQKRKHTPPSSL